MPSDERMLALADEVGLTDEVSFSPVGVGFYVDGEMHPFNGLGDFARFPPLSLLGRARLAWFVLQCQLRARLHGTREDAARALAAAPLRPARVRAHLAPAAELPLRLAATTSCPPPTCGRAPTGCAARGPRAGAGETMGCIRGGHERLIEAIGDRARSLGVDIRLGAGVEGLVLGSDGAVKGVQVDGKAETFDLTIATLQPPALRRLLPEQLQPLLEPYPKRFLGVVCLVMEVKESLLPYYSVNICDPTPITTVVETSHVVGTEHTGGNRLVYLPKYCEASAPEFTEDDQSVYDRFTEMLGKLAPGFRHEDVVAWTVQRAPLVEPVHARGVESRIAPVWPDVDGLALASASQVYPRLLNGDSIVRMAEATAVEAIERLGLDAGAHTSAPAPLAAAA